MESRVDGVRLRMYRFFASEGRAPTTAELARAVGLPQGETEEALLLMAERHLVVLRPGTHDIWMANPYSGIETDFRVAAGDRNWCANCIWDAFGILALAGRPGTISTHCPDCGDPIDLSVDASATSPDDGIVHFAVPASRWWDDIGYT